MPSRSPGILDGTPPNVALPSPLSTEGLLDRIETKGLETLGDDAKKIPLLYQNEKPTTTERNIYNNRNRPRPLSLLTFKKSTRSSGGQNAKLTTAAGTKTPQFASIVLL